MCINSFKNKALPTKVCGCLNSSFKRELQHFVSMVIQSLVFSKLPGQCAQTWVDGRVDEGDADWPTAKNEP